MAQFSRRGGFLILALWAGLTLAGGARAQGERAQLQLHEQALFERTMANPGDPDIALAYADAAARLGDNEAAVSALERLLLFNPNLPRVDLELGTLYLRMGSLGIARTYFEKAAMPGAPPDVAARAQEYLGHVAAGASPSRFVGYIFSGLQYQSDANVAPASAAFQSPVGTQLLGNHFVKHSDLDVFASGAALYSYDLGTQNRDTIEVLGTAFGDHYIRVDSFDLAFAELTVGPRFNFPGSGPDGAGSSVKPYLIANDVLLGGSEYFFTYGAGVEGRTLLLDDLLLKAVFEFRQKNFANSNNVIGTALNGDDKLVSLQLRKPVPWFRDSALSLEFDYLDQSTHKTYFANQTYGGTLGYEIRYPDPTGSSHTVWDTTLFVSRVWSNYDSPDPCCSTSGIPGVFSPSTRNDRHWRFGISHTIEAADGIDVVVQLQRDIVTSNLPIYAYSSNSVVIGPKIRF